LAALDRMADDVRNQARRIDLFIATARTRLPRAIKHMEEGLETARALALGLGGAYRYARASSLMAAFEWSYGNIDNAVSFSHEGLNACKDIFDEKTYLQTLARLGGILADKGSFYESRDVLLAAKQMLPHLRSQERFGLAVIAPVGVLS